MNLTLAPGILDEVVKHARSCYPREGCGLLTTNRFIPVTNIAESAAEFEMDPAELINALRDLRSAGKELAGIYHSHPHGPAHPSKVDVERAYYPEAAHLIVSLAEPERPQTLAFRIVGSEVLPVEVHVIV